MRCGFRSHSQRRERRARPSGCIDGRRCAGERTRTHARRARATVPSPGAEPARSPSRVGARKVASRRKDGQARHAGRDPLEGGAGDAGHPGHRGERPSGSRRAPDERQEGGGEREVASHLPRPRLGVNNRPRRGGPNGNASPVGRPRVASDASADVSASDRSTSPILPPTPAIHPSRPRELSLDVPASPRARADGTRSTPGTPPSHRKTRLIPAPDLAAETSGASDLDAHTPAHVTEMHISQFAESLRALRDLGISGIRDLDGSFREASEEQESEQMRVLLEERSRAREMVRKLERDKEMQAEQLRMMEERMIDHELTEEELAGMEEALARARGTPPTRRARNRRSRRNSPGKSRWARRGVDACARRRRGK